MISRFGKNTDPGTSRGNRVQEGVSVLIAGESAVIYGFTNVQRSATFLARIGGSEHQRYHFMRTYTLVDGQCLLLANHTMQIPEDSL